MKKKEFTLPTLIGLLVATAGLISGLWLVQRQKNTTTEAAGAESPTEVKVANVSDTGFNVSWTTSVATTGFVQYGEGVNTPDVVVSDERDQQKGRVDNYFTHYITVKGLKPALTYTFKIGSGKTLYDDNGQNYRITTGSEINTTPAADVVYGQVLTSNGDPAEGAIVYVQLPGAGMLSGLVKATGSWVVPLSTARTLDGNSFVIYNKKTTMNVMVIDGTLGNSSLITIAGGGNPVPQITLGNNYDLTVASNTASSSANMSKFSQINPVSETQVGGNGEVKLIAPKLDEKVNNTKPVIIGQAPAGTKITLEIHSDEVISASVVTGKDGTFSYAVPNNLSPGEHTLTISAVINGAVQKVTRTFTVYAAGESGLPAFTATPSATLKPTPLPTAKPTVAPTKTLTPTATVRPTVAPTLATTPVVTVKPTATLVPTATVKPTLAPTVKPTAKPTVVPATSSAMPVSGSTDWTWMTLVLGGLMMVSGVWWYKKTPSAN